MLTSHAFLPCARHATPLDAHRSKIFRSLPPALCPPVLLLPSPPPSNRYKDVLQKLARETTNLKKIEVEQAGIQKQVHSKEDRLKRMEGSLVRALMEQQRKLLTIISSVGRHATVEDVPMSAGAG